MVLVYGLGFSTPTGISLGLAEPHSFSGPSLGGFGKVVDSERMLLCEEEVVTIIKNKSRYS